MPYSAFLAVVLMALAMGVTALCLGLGEATWRRVWRVREQGAAPPHPPGQEVSDGA